MSMRLDRGVAIVEATLPTELTKRKAYSTPWILRTENPGEVDLTQVGGPLNRQPVDSFILAEIKDVYKGTAIDPKYYPSSLKAAKAVFTSKEIWSISSNATADTAVLDERHFPVTASVTLTIPTSIPLNEETADGDEIRAVVQNYLNDILGTAADRIVDQLYGALDARQDIVTPAE